MSEEAGHDHEHESPYREGDAAAWERPLRDTELYVPHRRDVANFVDETKMAHIRPLLPRGGRVIEVGAGSGRLLCRVGLAGGFSLFALDYAAYAMRAVRENYRRAGLAGHALLGDVRALPFPDGAFDVVLSGGLLEHFRDPAPILGEMRRILRAGGLLYADIVPRKVSLYRWPERERMAHEEHMAEGIFESALSKREWHGLARAAGLASVRVISAGVHPPYTFRGHEDVTWRYARFFRALDGTPVADVLGWFYMLTARKA